MTRFGVALVGTVTALAAGATLLVFFSRNHAGAEMAAVPAPADAPPAAPAAPAPIDARVPVAAVATDGGPYFVPANGPIQRLASGVTGPEREELVALLRRTPGQAAEDALIAEARGGPQPSTRTMAMDALAERRTERALAALAEIARTDGDLPARPLIALPRDNNDPSTELPDEQTFTPRMQAMAALAETRDPRAVPALAEMARHGPDESLRMEAARHLGSLRADPRAAEALRAATSDPSAYVRLSALHGMNGSTDPALPALLAQLAAHDRDAGVRALAQQVLATLLHQ